jgi:uncharacterized membrane protein
MPSAAQLGVVISAFLASAVEFVEALTIVLAMGVARSWRAALWGTALAVAALAGVTVALGAALGSYVSRPLLQLIVGTLLLIFGLQWLRKAILRAAGLKAQHDEDAIYGQEQAAARAAPTERRLGLDWYAFTISFKGVLLEGLEVVFIVLTFGANQHDVPLASVGAAAAVIVVVVAGFAVRAPLARVPENSLKFVVGVLLTSFGTFWGAEGAGASWPGSDAALLGVIAFVLAVAVVLVALLRRVQVRRTADSLAAQTLSEASR